MSSTTILTILALLAIKHWYFDFVHQTDEHIKHKGIYGHPKGLEHSGWHGFATFLIFWLVLPTQDALFFGLVDFFLHYHIDYVKMRYGNKEISDKQFWTHLGLDQLAHNLTYILLIWLLIGL
jgi:hypothetical protein